MSVDLDVDISPGRAAGPTQELIWLLSSVLAQVTGYHVSGLETRTEHHNPELGRPGRGIMVPISLLSTDKFLLIGCASSSLEDTRPQEETNKSYKSASNNLTGSSQPASRLPPTPENCSDHSQLGSLDCPENLQCQKLSKECLICDFNCTCVYGQEVNVTCRPKRSCKGKQEVTVQMKCRYCYQTSHWEHTCLGNNQCHAVRSPRKTFTSNCTVNSDVLCLGNRVFRKKLHCNWTSGYKWSTALLLSITLGGFGADRFYLGHWQEGIGKLFSFGGLGVWTIIDVILIAIRYLGPADHSLYI